MIRKDLLGRYEGKHGNREMYASFTYKGEDLVGVPTYTYKYGCVGFEPVAVTPIVGDEDLQDAIERIGALGFRKMSDDAEILMTERPYEAYAGLKAWFEGGN